MMVLLGLAIAYCGYKLGRLLERKFVITFINQVFDDYDGVFTLQSKGKILTDYRLGQEGVEFCFNAKEE